MTIDDETIFGALDLTLGVLPGGIRIGDGMPVYKHRGNKTYAVNGRQAFLIEDEIMRLFPLRVKEAERTALDYMIARRLCSLAFRTSV